MDFRYVKLTEEGNVGILTLYRPPINAINGDVLREILTSLEGWKGDPNIRAVVLCGGIRNAFCTGGDIGQLFGDDMATLGTGDKKALFWHFQEIYSSIEAYSKPTIAAINGIAIGGGLELALVCDLRVAADVSYFSMPELKHGIIPGLGATQRLPRFIGAGRAKEMLMLGKMVRAETALSWGLVDRVVPRAEVVPTAVEIAQDLADKPVTAVQALKQCCLQDGGDGGVVDGLRRETEAFTRLVDERIAAELAREATRE